MLNMLTVVYFDQNLHDDKKLKKEKKARNLQQNLAKRQFFL